MRRANLSDALGSIPSNGYVECFQNEHNARDVNDQFMLLSLLAPAASLAAVIAGNSVAAIATVDGLTTGLIPATAEHVSVTSSVATKQISLPAAVAGKRIRITGPANGCELISAVAADKVNNVVVGVTNEAALVAGTLYTLEYDGVDNWIMTGLTALGAVETPVIPNIL